MVEETAERFIANGSGGTGFQTGGRDQSHPDMGVWAFGGTTGVVGTSDTGEGVHGLSDTYVGIRGISRLSWGVWGQSDNRNGVFGMSSGVFDAAADNEDMAAGVNGRNLSSGYGVVGNSSTGVGVYGRSHGDGDGVQGHSGVPNRSGVWGENPLGNGVSGTGVVGVSGTGDKAGVVGTCSIDGDGVSGTSEGNGNGVSGIGGANGVEGNSTDGNGVSGISVNGIGGSFIGGERGAAIYLGPSIISGPPQTGNHSLGELIVDSQGNLYFCTQGDGTTLGTWKKVQLV